MGGGPRKEQREYHSHAILQKRTPRESAEFSKTQRGASAAVDDDTVTSKSFQPMN